MNSSTPIQASFSFDEELSIPFPSKWIFITNHPNMMYLLAQGLFLDYRDFGEKYYPDLLRYTPGYMVFFNGNFSQKEVNLILSEKFLFPVLARISLVGFQGRVHAICDDGSKMEIDLSCKKTSRPVRLILVPAGLAISVVEALIFKNRKDKDDFFAHAANLGNVAVSKYNLEVSEKLFSQNHQKMDWSAISHSIPILGHDSNTLNTVLGIGGSMTMIYHLAQQNLISSGFYRSLMKQSDQTPIVVKSDSILSHFPLWVNAMIPYSGTDIGSRLFWDIVQYMASCALKEDEVQYQVLEILKKFLEDAEIESQVKERLSVLHLDLLGLKSFGGETLSTLFQRHKRPLSKALICLFQFRTCAELLNLSTSLPGLDDNSWQIAAVLFGVREKWDRLPNGLRGSQNFSRFITAHMMHLAYKKRGFDLDWTTPPESPQPLAALLLPENLPSGRQREKLKETRLYLSRKMKWDCIATSIDLGAGKYEMEVKPSGVRLRLHGDVKCVNTEIDLGKFSSGLSRLPLPLDEKLEWEIREKLGESQPNRSSVGAKRKSRSKTPENVDQ